MKRLSAFLSAFSLIGLIGRHPAIAGVMTLLGAGGVVVSGMLTPPSITPQVSAMFDNNAAALGSSNNALKTDGGSTGAMQLPSTSPCSASVVTCSFFFTIEGTVDPYLGYAASNSNEYVLGNGGSGQGLALAGNGNGSPAFVFQKISAGGGYNWWTSMVGSDPYNLGPVSAVAGSGYNSGLYQWTGSGGGCAREPSGIWWAYHAAIFTVDPGFACQTTPTVSIPSIPGVGARQSTGSSFTT